MPNYSTSANYNTITPAPAGVDKRVLSPVALLFALLFALTWPLFLGSVVGVFTFAITNDPTFFKWAVGVGLAVGVLLSGSTLTGSMLLFRVSTMQPQTMTVKYATASTVENIRIVPLNLHDKFIDNMPVRDIAWFCRGLSFGMLHSQRAWIGKVTPSGRVIDIDTWRGLCKPLRRAGLIIDAGPRKSGELKTRDLDKMLSVLGIEETSDLWRLEFGTDLTRLSLREKATKTA